MNRDIKDVLNDLVTELKNLVEVVMNIEKRVERLEKGISVHVRKNI